MNIFGCKFCNDETKYTPEGICVSDRDEDKDRKNFDSLLWSLVTVFQVHINKLCMEKIYIYRVARPKLVNISHTQRELKKYTQIDIFLSVITI